MKIVGINQNSPNFGALVIPAHSSKVSGRQNINHSEEIVQYLEYLKELGLAKKAFTINRQTTKGHSTPITLIMTKYNGKQQNEIKETLEALGAKEIKPIELNVAKKILLDSKKVDVMDKKLNEGIVSREVYEEQLKTLLDLKI